MSSAGGAASPGCEDFVGWRCGDCGFGDCEEFAADEPGYRGLRGAFGDADGFGELLIADLDVGATLIGFGGEPEIDEKARGAAVVSGEVAHKDVGYVGIEFWHLCDHAISMITIAMKRQLRRSARGL